MISRVFPCYFSNATILTYFSKKVNFSDSEIINQIKRYLLWVKRDIIAGQEKRAGSFIFILYIKQEVKDITVLYLIIFTFK
jgi:hypothetical protein